MHEKSLNFSLSLIYLILEDNKTCLPVVNKHKMLEKKLLVLKKRMSVYKKKMWIKLDV